MGPSISKIFNRSTGIVHYAIINVFGPLLPSDNITWKLESVLSKVVHTIWLQYYIMPTSSVILSVSLSPSVFQSRSLFPPLNSQLAPKLA